MQESQNPEITKITKFTKYELFGCLCFRAYFFFFSYTKMSDIFLVFRHGRLHPVPNIISPTPQILSRNLFTDLVFRWFFTLIGTLVRPPSSQTGDIRQNFTAERVCGHMESGWATPASKRKRRNSICMRAKTWAGKRACHARPHK